MLSIRATCVLCVLMLLLAAGTCWAVSDAALVPALLLPETALASHFVVGFALVLAAFAAPLVFSETELRDGSPRLLLIQTAMAALWFGIAVAFMMVAASRISPVNGVGIAQAALWPAFIFWLVAGLARTLPRAACAIVFLWIVALPMSAYMLAEVYLNGPAGGSGYAQSTGPIADALRASIHWMLNLSPGTATIGALTGTLADGSVYSFWSATAFKIVIGILVCALILKSKSPRAALETNR